MAFRHTMALQLRQPEKYVGELLADIRRYKSP
jgi:hypothetical protein